MLFTSNMLGMINILTAHCLLIDNSKWLPSQNTVAQGITYLVCSSHSSFLFIPCWFLPVPVASLCPPDSRLCQTPHRQFIQCLSWWPCWKYSWEGARDCSVDSNIFLFSCALWKLNSFWLNWAQCSGWELQPVLLSVCWRESSRSLLAHPSQVASRSQNASQSTIFILHLNPWSSWCNNWSGNECRGVILDRYSWVWFRVAKCQFFYTEQNPWTKFYPNKSA